MRNPLVHNRALRPLGWFTIAAILMVACPEPSPTTGSPADDFCGSPRVSQSQVRAYDSFLARLDRTARNQTERRYWKLSRLGRALFLDSMKASEPLQRRLAAERLNSMRKKQRARFLRQTAAQIEARVQSHEPPEQCPAKPSPSPSLTPTPTPTPSASPSPSPSPSPTPAPRPFVMWGNLGGNCGVSAAEPDNSGGIDVMTACTGPGGIAVDSAAGFLYWVAQYGGPDLRRVSFDPTTGAAVGEITLSHAGATMDNPFGVAINPAANKIYWANHSGNKISMANLDGSGGGSDLNTLGATVDDPYGVAVDPVAGKIYWANSIAFGSPDPGQISWANLDGSGGGDMNTLGATVNEAQGVALDVAGGKIYWANNAANKISWANLDGSGGGDLVTTGAKVIDPTGVAVDPVGGRVYWTNFGDSSVSWAALDGSGGADLNTTGADINAPLLPTFVP